MKLGLLCMFQSPISAILAVVKKTQTTAQLLIAILNCMYSFLRSCKMDFQQQQQS